MSKFKNILYVLGDKTSESSASLIRTVTLAKNNQADLTLLYVLAQPALSSYAKEFGVDNQAVERKVLAHKEASIRQIIDSFDKDINVELRVGRNYIESIRAVQADNFDLIVKEADRFSWLDRFIGSDDMNLLRECPCPVWLMKEDEKQAYEHIMAAVGFDAEGEETCNDELNEMIVDLAGSLSQSGFTSLNVVNAYNVPEASYIRHWVDEPDDVERKLFESEYQLRKQKMNALFNDLKQRWGEERYLHLAPRSLITRGIAGQELPKVADDIGADLVVMGTVARTGLAGLIIGNTAETVFTQLKCSVLAVKPKGFISPVS